MRKIYATLDEYLDDLDKIKETVAAETKGMSPEQVKAYYGQAREELARITGKKRRVRRGRRSLGAGKR
jgi:hypothetical protein